MSIQFTAKEMELMYIFPKTTKQVLMQAILAAQRWMVDTELTAISRTVLYKISQLSEEEFRSIRFEPAGVTTDK